MAQHMEDNKSVFGRGSLPITKAASKKELSNEEKAAAAFKELAVISEKLESLGFEKSAAATLKVVADYDSYDFEEAEEVEGFGELTPSDDDWTPDRYDWDIRDIAEEHSGSMKGEDLLGTSGFGEEESGIGIPDADEFKSAISVIRSIPGAMDKYRQREEMMRKLVSLKDRLNLGFVLPEKEEGDEERFKSRVERAIGLLTEKIDKIDSFLRDSIDKHVEERAEEMRKARG